MKSLTKRGQDLRREKNRHKYSSMPRLKKNLGGSVLDVTKPSDDVLDNY